MNEKGVGDQSSVARWPEGLGTGARVMEKFRGLGGPEERDALGGLGGFSEKGF